MGWDGWGRGFDQSLHMMTPLCNVHLLMLSMDLLNNYVTQGITVASFIIIIICMFHSKYTYVVLCKTPSD